MIKQRKDYKHSFLRKHMKEKRGFDFCNNYLKNIAKVFYSDISCINLTGVTKFTTSCGLSGNRTHTSYFGDTRATTTLLAH
jgi:hypothetical protein